MGPRPLPGCRGEEKALIAEVYQVSANHTGLVAPPEFSDVGTCAFHSWPVRAALENRVAHRSVIRKGGEGGFGSGVFPCYLQRYIFMFINVFPV